MNVTYHCPVCLEKLTPVIKDVFYRSFTVKGKRKSLKHTIYSCPNQCIRFVSSTYLKRYVKIKLYGYEGFGVVKPVQTS